MEIVAIIMLVVLWIVKALFNGVTNTILSGFISQKSNIAIDVVMNIAAALTKKQRQQQRQIRLSSRTNRIRRYSNGTQHFKTVAVDPIIDCNVVMTGVARISTPDITIIKAIPAPIIFIDDESILKIKGLQPIHGAELVYHSQRYVVERMVFKVGYDVVISLVFVMESL